MGIIRFIVRERKLVTVMRVGVIIPAMGIYRVLFHLKIQSPLCMRSYVDSKSLSPNAPSSTLEQGDNQPSTQSTPENDQPIAIRKPTRSSNILAYLNDYKHDISNFISYEFCNHQSFVTSLYSVSIPTNWKLAREDSKWKEAMLEDMRALEKNRTWELVNLLQGKQPVRFKWGFTIKNTLEGKVERYKARLMAKGYTQTYGIDCDETFAPAAKMNLVRTLIYCAVNLDRDIYQIDVKNAFLHG